MSGRIKMHQGFKKPEAQPQFLPSLVQNLIGTKNINRMRPGISALGFGMRVLAVPEKRNIQKLAKGHLRKITQIQPRIRMLPKHTPFAGGLLELPNKVRIRRHKTIKRVAHNHKTHFRAFLRRGRGQIPLSLYTPAYGPGCVLGHGMNPQPPANQNVHFWGLGLGLGLGLRVCLGIRNLHH